MLLLSLPRLGERYSPLYFLAALGAGGLAVSFFMWLMFWVPHPGHPVPLFEDILAALRTANPALQAAIYAAWAGIGFFALAMLRLLIWNAASLARFARSPAGAALRESDGATQLLAAPLAVAMAVNVGFIIGIVFVPNLWSVVELLFPLAMIAFLAIGVWALNLMRGFWGRLLTAGGFDCARNNSFAQLLPAFALAMIGVGLAAPAAMSQTAWVAGLSFVASTFFVTTALALAALKMTLGLRAMMENGANPESAPSLLIMVPILTVAGIAFMRQGHGLHAHFDAHAQPAETFVMLTRFLALQLGFTLFGWLAMSRQGYFGRFVTGAERSAGSYALVCPGVALSVIGHFFINKGLVAVGLVAKFGPAYWALTALPLAMQIATIWLVLTLNAKHFGAPHGAGTPAAAE